MFKSTVKYDEVCSKQAVPMKQQNKWAKRFLLNMYALVQKVIKLTLTLTLRPCTTDLGYYYTLVLVHCNLFLTQIRCVFV
jgi:hypothetical protein